MKTVDGVEINPGDTVWVKGKPLDREPKKAIVGGILSEYKVLYAKPVDGYIGARISALYHNKENAYYEEEESYWKRVE